MELHNEAEMAPSALLMALAFVSYSFLFSSTSSSSSFVDAKLFFRFSASIIIERIFLSSKVKLIVESYMV